MPPIAGLTTGHLDYLLGLVATQTKLLNSERREREKLLIRVDEMQKTIQDLVEWRDKLTRPKPMLQTGSDSVGSALKRKQPVSQDESNKSPQKSSFRPEIFETGKGIKLPFKGKAIRVRLPKPPPTASAQSLMPGHSTSRVDPSGTTASRDKPPARRNLFTADVFSAFRKATGSADMPTSLSGSPSVFNFNSGHQAVTSQLKFNFVAPPTPKDLVFTFKALEITETGVASSQRVASSTFGFITGLNATPSSKPPQLTFTAPSTFNFSSANSAAPPAPSYSTL
ncbi:hypothetical protein B0T18DRAFT_404918 [Schizothecium vesticola]|uniref:Uncharacterized protein n=1 Tax=Schizothecium vesticola TaxID=314040 RepID=A0AA40KAW5_9PEZI|nr:hypothetical protein B0T18DRAFT_404918 [Schizothecium vesticola]